MEKMDSNKFKEIVNKLYKDVDYIAHEVDNNTIKLTLKASKPADVCPHCGKTSKRVHSYHWRYFKDLPIEGFILDVALNSRKFFCVNQNCKYKTFAENFDFIEPTLKTTKRLNEKINEIAQTTTTRKAVIELARLGIKTDKTKVWKATLKNTDK